MGQSSRPRRTIVQALDDLTAEVRVSNHLAALGLGTAALDDVALSAKNDMTARRQSRMNRQRAVVRAVLDPEGETSGDHS